jgi:protein-arginine kinase activator protein McsA
MFRRRKNFNDLFGDFDAMFSQFESMFGGMPINSESESGTDENGDWTKESYTSPDGKIFITNFVRNGSSNKSSGINSLKRKLQMAIEEENFEEAVKLRDEIKTYESNQDSINKLEMELKKSIEEQDFEKSIEIRDQLKKLKS